MKTLIVAIVALALPMSALAAPKESKPGGTSARAQVNKSKSNVKNNHRAAAKSGRAARSLKKGTLKKGSLKKVGKRPGRGVKKTATGAAAPAAQ